MEGYGFEGYSPMRGETMISIPRSEYKGLIENQMRLKFLIDYIDSEIEDDKKMGFAGHRVSIETATYLIITGDNEPEDDDEQKDKA